MVWLLTLQLGTSPLHLAAQHGHYSTADVLLRAGVSRDARTKVDRTPLHMAAAEGHAVIVELLVRVGTSGTWVTGRLAGYTRPLPARPWPVATSMGLWFVWRSGWWAAAGLTSSQIENRNSRWILEGNSLSPKAFGEGGRSPSDLGLVYLTRADPEPWPNPVLNPTRN